MPDTDAHSEQQKILDRPISSEQICRTSKGPSTRYNFVGSNSLLVYEQQINLSHCSTALSIKEECIPQVKLDREEHIQDIKEWEKPMHDAMLEEIIKLHRIVWFYLAVKDG